MQQLMMDRDRGSIVEKLLIWSRREAGTVSFETGKYCGELPVGTALRVKPEARALAVLSS